MRRIGSLAVMFGLVLTAACGGGSSTKTVSASTVPGAPSTGAPTASTTIHLSGSSDSKFCDKARVLSDKTKVAPNQDLRAAFANFDQEADQTLAVAPGAIKADLVVVIDGARTLKNALAAANYDFSKVDPAAYKGLQDPKFVTSAQRVTAYLEQVCGIKSPGTTASTPPITASTPTSSP